VENCKYGWFWTCPNGGDACMYRHALPPGKYSLFIWRITLFNCMIYQDLCPICLELFIANRHALPPGLYVLLFFEGNS